LNWSKSVIRALVPHLLAGGFLILATPVLGEDSNASGQELAERLRTSIPEENSEVHGVLQIRAGKQRKEIPIACLVILGDTLSSKAATNGTWSTIYQTAATNQAPAEKLIVVHSTSGPNKYLFARASTNPEPVASTNISLPFAGSDFSLGDLGLEFLHWPQQKRLTSVMRLGRGCYVLESSNTNAAPAIRVKSYIDEETGGILIAEAYDAQGKLVKEFSLHGSSFKKVNGRWQLEKMEIRSPRTGSQTTMKFDLPKEQH